EHDVADGLPGPVVLLVAVDLVEPAPTGRAALLIPFPPFGAFLRNGAAEIHRDRGVAAARPQLRPVGERGPAAAVDQHHGRHFAFRFRNAEPGEDPRGIALPRHAVVEDRLEPLGLKAFSVGGLRRLRKRVEVPRRLGRRRARPFDGARGKEDQDKEGGPHFFTCSRNQSYSFSSRYALSHELWPTPGYMVNFGF